MKRSPSASWPYIRARFGSIFLHHGMSAEGARRLLGEPSQKTHSTTIFDGGPAVSSGRWDYRFSGRTLTADFDNSNTISGWRWGHTKGAPGSHALGYFSEIVTTTPNTRTNEKPLEIDVSNRGRNLAVPAK
jgi:hypothetical protein